MTYFSQQIPALLFAASLGAMAANPVFAQSGAAGMSHHAQHRQGKMMEQHHEQLHQALKLTAEQEPLWKNLMASEHPASASTASKPGELAKLTVPERLELKLERAKAHQAQMATHLVALKALYQTLTPEQKKTFEEFHNKRQPGMHHKTPHHSMSSEKPAAKP